jgi:hypothetical protein
VAASSFSIAESLGPSGQWRPVVSLLPTEEFLNWAVKILIHYHKFKEHKKLLSFEITLYSLLEERGRFAMKQ